ncbi:MAG: hypothetical protein HY959_03240 [Ignavibacteriae bacterium]|nr:hypothetical protein [Ignavibacteriota bacterium]
MKKNYFIILLALILILSETTTAQLLNTKVFRKPNVVMEATFGYGLPGFDFSGSRLKDFWEFKGYGVNGGYYAAYTPKVTVHNFKDGQIRTYLTIAFSNFYGKENTSYDIGNVYDTGMVPVRWPADTTYKSVKEVTGSSSIRISAPYIAYGWEIALYTDKERRSIFNFGADFNFSVMWGKVYDQAASNNYEYHNNIVSATRLGMGLNLGYSYRIVDYLGVTFGTRMHIANLINKGSDQVKAGGDGDMYLNDAANSSLNSLMSKSRTVGFFGFYGGVSFYLGGKR